MTLYEIQLLSYIYTSAKAPANVPILRDTIKMFTGIGVITVVGKDEDNVFINKYRMTQLGLDYLKKLQAVEV